MTEKIQNPKNPKENQEAKLRADPLEKRKRKENGTLFFFFVGEGGIEVRRVETKMCPCVCKTESQKSSIIMDTICLVLLAKYHTILSSGHVSFPTFWL